jgi:hydrogenase assembly chaperone HypC/HupF
MCLGLIGVVNRTFDEDGVPMAEVDSGDGPRSVCLLYCPDAAVGDDVLTHMGFVMEVLDPQRAADSRELRRQLVLGDSDAAVGDER